MLERQIIDVDLLGIDTKTDPKKVLSGRLLSLADARFVKGGRISKRLGSSIYATGSDEWARLFTLKNRLFYARTGATDELYGYSSIGSSLSSYGRLAVPEAKVIPITNDVSGGYVVGTNNERWKVDAGSTGGNMYGYASSTDQGLRLTWYYNYGGAVVASLQTSITCDGVRIVSGTNLGVSDETIVFLAYKQSAGQILLYTATPSGTTLRATLTGVNTGGSTAHWDAAATTSSGHIFVVHHETTADTIKIWSITTSSWATASATFASGGTVGSLTVSAYTDARVFWSVGAAVSTRTYSTAVANTLATTSVASSSVAGTVTHLAASVRSAGTVDLVINSIYTYALATGDGYFPVLDYYSVSSAGAASGLVSGYGLWIGSKINTYVESTGGTNRLFIIGLLGTGEGSVSAAEPDEQRAYVLLEISSEFRTRARLLYGTANHAPSHYPNAGSTKEILPNFFGGQSMFCAAQSIARNFTVPGGGGAVSSNGVLLSFSNDTKNVGWHATECARQLLIGGGFLQSFDGTVVRENGFLHAPAIVGGLIAGGGALPDGTYSTICLYERTNALGEVIESSVSVPRSFVVSGRAGAGKITLHATNYRLRTTPDLVYQRITLYVTDTNGRQHYRYQSVVPTTSGVPVELFTISALPDTTQAIVYTDASEDDNAQPDGPSMLVSETDRVWCVSGNDSLRVEVCKPVIAGYGIAFYPDFGKQVPSGGGPITALARLDGNLFAFKRDSINYATGEGPDLLSGNNTLSEFTGLPSSFGAVGHRHVVRTGDALLVGTTHGIHQIGRDLSMSYIGAPVEDLTAGATIYDSCFLAEVNEVRFITDSMELVYNTEFGQWSKNLGAITRSMVSVGGVRYYINSSNLSILYEYGFGASAYSMTIETGWIKVGSLQGCMRVYEILLLGESKSAHTLNVMISYDYDTTTAEESHTITHTNATTGNSAYQIAVKPNRQRCQAIKIRIADSAISGTNEGYNLAGVSLLVGLKRGAAKLRSEKVA